MMRGGDDDDHLWAKAAELERQFQGYKRRIAERKPTMGADRPDGDGGGELGGGDGAEAVVGSRGRKYEAYVRRRDEKLRQGWRARMQRKEAEMMALWARLDDSHRRRTDSDHLLLVTASGHVKQQKPGNLEASKPTSSSTPRSSSATKSTLSRPRTPRSTMPSPSPAAAAASPRLSSSSTLDSRRRSQHRDPSSQIEPPSTPRKENRMPPLITASPAAATPRLRALSRSRSSLKEYSVRDSPRPAPPLTTTRFQSPRPSHDGAAAAADAVARRQVVLAEIKTAAAIRVRRSVNGAAAAAASPSPRPVIAPQVDGRRRPSRDTGKTIDAQMIPSNLDIKSKNFSVSEDDDAAESSVKLDDLMIAGDSDEAMNNSQSQFQPLVAPDSNPEETEAPAPDQSEKETEDLEEEVTAMATSESKEKETPEIDEQQDDSSPESSSDQSFYSNVDSSFSHRSSELAASATCSPLHGSPSSTTEQLLEADAAMLRKKREEEEEDDEVAAAGEIKRLLIPAMISSGGGGGVACPVAGAVQSPMEAVAGLKRFLTFGKKNGGVKAGAGEGAAADDDGVGEEWTGDSGVRQRICYSDAASSDDSDNNYVISAHVRSLQSCVPCSSAKPVLLKELISSVKSPRAHRSFFSFSSFKSRGY
uniref:Uncharacterized protein n=1 Tax=Leersia perrieri TaxID=77586 RepID=A0A0D9WMX1_9ORYZ